MLILALLLLAAPPDASGTYRIETPKIVHVKKGAQGVAKVEVVPRSDAHVDPAAPISLTVSADPGVTLAKAKLGRPDAKETKAKGVEFDVPFTAQSSGAVKGSLSFFICTDKLCERQKRDVAVAVEVE